ncbi:MAG: chemotaxis protein CheB [Mariniblastus sp.]
MSQAEKQLFVVGIGASAGGLKPIEEFFSHMPVDSGMAFVVVQHLSPDFKSLMDELLARRTGMAIHKVSDGIKVEANSVYLIPPEKNMALEKGRLMLTDKTKIRIDNLPIDIFFRSLAKGAGENSVAVVLSGTGSDGSRGIKDIHESGGLVLVQSIETTGFDGMPRAAISTGVVDLICSPEEMPARIVEYASTHDRAALRQVDSIEGGVSVDESAMYRIFRLFRQNFNLDFSLYKPTTITRRIERRMQLCAIKDMDEYVDSLESNIEEIEDLYRDLLVEVTHFFRDPEAFKKLRETVIPSLINRCDPEQEIRVWVSGCATGEEAYSVAILLAEAIANADRAQTFKVFATDVHRKSLQIASAGFYPTHALDSVPPELQTYFVRNNGICNVKREIRKHVIFAANDLTKDPPFTRIDLITCRNVLIYLEPPVQLRVLSMFHFGLKVGGVLFLGPSETVGDLSKEFVQVDRHWRIYSKKRDVRLPDATRIPMTPVLGAVIHEHAPSFLAQNPMNTGTNNTWLSTAYEELLAKHVPPSLLVDEHNELVHCFGTARKLLSPPEGKPSNDILRMLERDLSVAVTSALHRAKQESIPVTYRGIRVEMGKDDHRLFRVTVEPYRKTDRSLFLISLEETGSKIPVKEVVEEEFQVNELEGERNQQLERELSYTRETLQATVEELESSNEELQATNEELIASNEELQSTNEELHSVNEELYTVNTEHKAKIEELTEMTSDLDNLFRSTEIGTVFLDRQLSIRMFTPSIKAGFNVVEKDIGRPLGHIASKLENPSVMDEAAEVLKSGIPIETEVFNIDGRAYLQRIQPYRVENSIEGIVLTLTDITAIKENEQARKTMATLTEISQELPDFAYAVSHDLQAPLRHISQYSQILDSAVDNKKDDEVHKATRVIRTSAESLRTMIDGLLLYSRVNTLGDALTKVNLEVSINAAILDLQTAIDAIRAEVTYDNEMPEVLGDSSQLKQLFFHLIDNAIKYRSERDPVIKISWRQTEEGVEISVSDNGIGVSEHNAEGVFTIFKRLGFKEYVPGAGVGLAICRRVALRHDGRIWISDSSSEGTTFSFNLRTPNHLIVKPHSKTPAQNPIKRET